MESNCNSSQNKSSTLKFLVEDFSQECMEKVVQATKASNAFSVTEEVEYFQTFDAYNDIMEVERDRILKLIQKVLTFYKSDTDIRAEDTNMSSLMRFAMMYQNNKSTNNRMVDWLKQIKEEHSRRKTPNDSAITSSSRIVEEVKCQKGYTDSMQSKESLNIVATPNRQRNIASWNKMKTDSPYKLNMSRIVERPQLSFSIGDIDNTRRPFYPKLVDKPNAILPLIDSLACDIVEGTIVSDESLFYPNPYCTEIEAFQPQPYHLQHIENPVMPADVRHTEFTIIDNSVKLSDLSSLLKKQKEFAVDLEHHSYRTYLGLTCLMQITVRDSDTGHHNYLVDTLALRSHLQCLNEAFTDPNIIKVLHGADMDILWLQRDLGLYIVNLFDTHQASRLLYARKHHSLSALLKSYCDVNANKQFQLADWRIRPLPEELVHYAVEDTHYLLYIYECLKLDLYRQSTRIDHIDLISKVFAASKDISSKPYLKPVVDDDSHMKMIRKCKTHSNFSSKQIHCLKLLFNWRDTIGRNEDESPGYVLPNHTMLQVSFKLPKEPAGLLACCNPIPVLVKQSINEIINLVAKARNYTEEKSDIQSIPIEMKPSNVDHPRYHEKRLLQNVHDTTPLINEPPR